MPATLPSWAAAVAGDWRPDLAGRAARGGTRAGRRGHLHSERADAGPLLIRTARHIRQRRGSARADRPAAKLARHRQRHGRGPRNAAIRRAGAGRDRRRHGLRWAYQGPDAVSWRPSLRRRRSHCLLGILNRHSDGNDSRPHPHREGAGLLQSYNCVLTGSHPEYHTPETLDALQQHVGDGGRLCYLGGNGFYWRIAASAAVPDVLEARRAKGGHPRVGCRAWRGISSTGRLLWRAAAAQRPAAATAGRRWLLRSGAVRGLLLPLAPRSARTGHRLDHGGYRGRLWAFGRWCGRV